MKTIVSDVWSSVCHITCVIAKGYGDVGYDDITKGETKGHSFDHVVKLARSMEKPIKIQLTAMEEAWHVGHSVVGFSSLEQNLYLRHNFFTKSLLEFLALVS